MMSQETYDMLTDLIAETDKEIDRFSEYTQAELQAMSKDEFLRVCFES